MDNLSNPPLFKLKLLDALKSNDITKVDHLYQQYAESESPGVNHLKTLVLHISIKVSSAKMFEQLLASPHYSKYLNVQDDDGNTPLHVACEVQRGDFIELLLAQPLVNDTILNAENKAPIDVIKNNPQLFNLVQLQRVKYVEEISNELRKSFTNRDFKALNRIYANSRNFELLDINGLDPDSGDTVLHEFIKKRDVEMVQWILGHGGDPFKRDKRGKLPIDTISKIKATGQADQLKKILKHASKEQSVIDPVSNTQSTLTNFNGTMEQAPTFKGYLKKWTNFASGYKLRWFILDSQGILSYYKNQDDINSNCRGSINLKNCRLHLDSSEKLKFEILGVKNANIKWHLRGNHSVETNRWVWAILNAIKFAKDREKSLKKRFSGSDFNTESANSSSTTLPEARKTNTKNAFEYTKAAENHLSALHLDAGLLRSGSGSSNIHHVRSNSELSQLSNGKSSILVLKNIDENKLLSPVRGSSGNSGSVIELQDDIDDNGSGSENLEIYQYEDELDSISIDSQIELSQKPSDMKFIGPYGNAITVKQQTLQVELQTLKELVGSLNEQGLTGPVLQAVDSIYNDYNVLLSLIYKNNFLILKKLNNEIQVNGLWESSIKELEQENIKNAKKVEHYEQERKKLRKIVKDKLLHSKPEDGAEADLELSRIVSGAVHEAEAESGGPFAAEAAHEKPAIVVNEDTDDQKLKEFVEENDQDSDTDDEFFDVDEFDEGYLEDTVEPKKQDYHVSVKEVGQEEIDGHLKPAPVHLNLVQQVKYDQLLEESTYNGYEDPIREKLGKDEDDRPKISLWGILKSMVGKDMTKITLPVSFNECTSLLQRVAEGVEYTELLDKAATLEDSALRLCYVAAFGASEYASTLNRVAKPFNPLLGETFEYARPDKNFRFFVEQVSHHPPISAALAESPKWDYYGESAVKSKFNGRSFDIKPLGSWYLQLRPDHGVVDSQEKKHTEELITWNRITSSVVGIIVGNPVVDNYGEMNLVNKTTGDSVVLNFKARGWRASSAYEVKGTVYNKDKKPCYLIKGHWNSKIFCKKVVHNEDIDHFDLGSKDDVFLLWQVNPRPPRPFNLTLFSISLNALQPHLKAWLAPTDTRLRPDQRAMEVGQYDEAAEEKNRVEEKQREARKKLEEKGLEYVPKFFSKQTHPVTKDSYWKYNGDYWKRRALHDLKTSGDIF